MTKELKHIAAMVLNQPLLCTPEYAETVVAVLGDRVGVDNEGMAIQDKESANKSWELTQSGTAVYPIVGGMVHRGSSMDALSGLNSYSKMQSDLQELADDPKVENIFLEIDSGGGAVAGAFDFRDFVMSLRGKKPVYALAKDTMGSAAYLIGSAAEKLYITQTGSVGSIGVVAMHTDQSKQNEEQGVKPTFIYAGEYKTAGNPHEPLEGKALQYLQDSVNDSYEMFVSAVAEARGLDAQVVRDTEARMFRGQKAVDLGLADQVASMEEALNLIAGANSAANPLGGKSMGVETMGVEELQESLETATKQSEALKAAIMAEGYVIREDGIAKDEPEEMIEVEGVQVAKSTIPSVVLDALTKAQDERADAELTQLADAELPNFSTKSAKTLLKAFGSDEEVMRELKAANAELDGLTEELGETAPLEISAKDRMSELVKSHAEANVNLTKEQAYTEVMKTPEGRELVKLMDKEV